MLSVDSGPNKVSVPPVSGRSGVVSVIVTAYNQEWVIAETLASVARQTYRPIECVVVNDGSRDKSGAVLDQFAREHETDLEWKVIHQQNTGAQGARNNGMRASTGEFIQWLDGDDLLAPGKLGKQVEFLSSPEGSRYDVVYGDSQWICGVGESAEIGDMIGIGPSDDVLASLLQLDPFNPPFAYLSRRTAIERIRGWDAALTINDDVDYFLQLACLSLANGRDFKFLPEFTGFYRKHSYPRISEGGLRLRVKFNRIILSHAEATMAKYDLFTLARRTALANAYYQICTLAAGWDWYNWRNALRDTIRIKPDFKLAKARGRFLQSIIGLWGVEALQALRRKATGKTCAAWSHEA